MHARAQDMRIDFQFSKGAFDFSFLPFTIPYPVPFKALGDETKVTLHSGTCRWHMSAAHVSAARVSHIDKPWLWLQGFIDVTYMSLQPDGLRLSRGNKVLLGPACVSQPHVLEAADSGSAGCEPLRTHIAYEVPRSFQPLSGPTLGSSLAMWLLRCCRAPCSCCRRKARCLQAREVDAGCADAARKTQRVTYSDWTELLS